MAEQSRALRHEGLSLREMTDYLLGPEDMMARITQNHFTKINLICSLLEGGCREE